jgi:hypothetical protein
MHRLIHFFKTPKGLLTILLVLLTAMAAPAEGAGLVIRNMGAAVLAAGLVDLVILRVRDGAWEYPGGAVLTAMIVAMVMRAQEPWMVPVVTSVVAVLSKYVIRTRHANVFNPAALALVLMVYVMPHGQSWWGALPEVSPLWMRAVLLVGGLYLTSRVNKLPLVLSFVGVYFCLFPAIPGRRAPRRRDLSISRHRCGDLLHARHPDRSADVASQVPGAVGFRCHHGAGELRRVHVLRCRLVPAGRRAGGEHLGSLATGPSAVAARVHGEGGSVPRGDQSAAQQPLMLATIKATRKAQHLA